MDSATGIDVSESMLRVARRKVHRSHLIQWNMLEKSCFPPKEFNLITAFRFFVNAEETLRFQALRSIRKALADDGILDFNNHHNIHSIRRGWARLIARIKRRPCNMNFLSMAQTRAMVAEAGFEIVEVDSVGLFNIPQHSLPAWIYHWADLALGEGLGLAEFSESPIIICRKSGVLPTACATHPQTQPAVEAPRRASSLTVR